jgi:predicted neuraminidase
MFDAAFIHGEDAGLRHAHAPSLAEGPDGDLVVAWYGYPEVEYEAGRIVVARHGRGGEPWADQVVLFDHVKSSLGNPVLFFTPDGRLHLLCALVRGFYWTDAVVIGATSDDGGRSWTGPRQIRPDAGLMVRHAPVARADGGMLLPAYDERRHEPILLAATPPYERWEPVARLAGTPLIQPALVRDGASRLIMLLRPADAERVVWRSESGDEGRTWSAPQPTPLPSAPSGLGGFWWNGDLAVVHNPTQGQERFPLSISLSRTGRDAWRGPRHVDTAAFELSYPCFLVGCDGNVHGVYSYNRRFIKYVTLDAAWWHEDPDGPDR